MLIAEGRQNFRKNIGFALMLMVVQILGGFAGCFASWLSTYENAEGELVPQIFVLKPFSPVGPDELPWTGEMPTFNNGGR